MRLDKFLTEKQNLPSRTYAENLILKGKVAVDGKIVTKPSYNVEESAIIEIIEDEGYASQGAYKLIEGLRVFSVNVGGKDAVDIGCSNGGFTDVLLRNGVKSVLAVDVADCALPEHILSDDRVTFLKANARDLTIAPVDFACTDVSFISLKLILPTIYNALKSDGECIALIKPQFELGKSALSKKGIVLSEKDRQKAIDTVKGYALEVGFEILGVTPSPVYYDNKNKEYLLYVKKP